MSKTNKRVRAALAGSTPTEQRTVKQVGDAVAVDGLGKPLTKRTIQAALAELSRLGLADSEDDGNGTAARWWET